jgi:hypothetical protein
MHLVCQTSSRALCLLVPLIHHNCRCSCLPVPRATFAGLFCCVVLPTPSWPLSFTPQHLTPPADISAHVNPEPHEIAAAEAPGVFVCLRVCVCVCVYLRSCARSCVRACVRACVHACVRAWICVAVRAHVSEQDWELRSLGFMCVPLRIWVRV